MMSVLGVCIGSGIEISDLADASTVATSSVEGREIFGDDNMRKYG